MITPEFRVERKPDQALLARVAALTPHNPFHTAAYAAARRALGAEVLILSLQHDGMLISASPAFARSGRLNRTLEITSLPYLDPAHDGVFWAGLREFCRRERITCMEVGSFASTAARIPGLGYELERTTRVEYALNLQAPDLWRQLSKGRKCDVKKGRSLGLLLRRTTDPAACHEHVRMMALSMERRSARGDTATQDLAIAFCEAMLQHGVGELFQAVLAGEVIASALIVRAAEGAYYQTAGASEAGRESGAQTFLLFETSKALQAEGCKLFNLGGAEPEQRGLQVFKHSFGARTVPLESARFFLGGAVRKKVDTALKLLRHDPGGFVKHLIGRVERYVVYSCEPDDVPPPPVIEGALVEKLSDEVLASLPTDQDFLRAQVERFRRLRFNDAYGVYYRGQLAHISWLVTADHDRRIPVRNVRLRDGEAEITHCVTWPEFRGLGIYTLAIRTLCQTAHSLGIQRVFMITSVKNVASQRGMQKAGLTPHGRIFRLAFSYLNEAGFTLRCHRWVRGGGYRLTETLRSPAREVESDLALESLPQHAHSMPDSRSRN